MDICKQLEELYPAYVLNAVDASDLQRIIRHLANCPACAEIVASYHPIADALPYIVPMVEPSVDLKYRVLASAVPQVKPLPAASFSNPFASLFRSPAFSAIALGLLLAFGIWNLSLQNQISQQAAASQKLADDFARERELVSLMAFANGAPMKLQGTEVAAQSSGRLYGAMEDTAVALLVDDLPMPASGMTYQLWFIDPDGTRMSGGTFTVDVQGHGWLMIHLPKPLKMYQSVGITVEPAGGSPKPTGPKMLGTSL